MDAEFENSQSRLKGETPAENLALALDVLVKLVEVGEPDIPLDILREIVTSPDPVLFPDSIKYPYNLNIDNSSYALFVRAFQLAVELIKEDGSVDLSELQNLFRERIRLLLKALEKKERVRIHGEITQRFICFPSIQEKDLYSFIDDFEAYFSKYNTNVELYLYGVFAEERGNSRSYINLGVVSDDFANKSVEELTYSGNELVTDPYSFIKVTLVSPHEFEEKIKSKKILLCTMTKNPGSPKLKLISWR